MRASPITRMSSVDPDQRVLSGRTCKRYKMSSFTGSRNIQKESESDRSVLDNQSSSVILDLLAMKARKNIHTVISSFSKESNTMTD